MHSSATDSFATFSSPLNLHQCGTVGTVLCVTVACVSADPLVLVLPWQMSTSHLASGLNPRAARKVP